MKPKSGKKQVVRGQPSWRLAADRVEAYVTELGGQVGPVTFHLKGKKVRPFSVAPWVEEKTDPLLPPILKVLRGDFFCLPFGGNATPYRGERHPVHGETANARWRFESLEANKEAGCLHLSLNTQTRQGRVDKRIFVRQGHTAVYCQHTLSGMKGPMNLGHHAMLRFPDRPGCGAISTSRLVFGQVFPFPFERPENRGYSLLKMGATFDSLERVPTVTGETADLTRYPARRGFEDLVLVVSDDQLPFAWTAVTFPADRHVWFALKNPRILRETIFWISNGGRHYPPWNGRHVNVLGLEEVTSFFHLGLAESARKNSLVQRGYPTCLKLNPQKPLVIPYLMGMAAVPAGFDRVAQIEAAADQRSITLVSTSGKRVATPLALEFLEP